MVFSLPRAFLAYPRAFLGFWILEQNARRTLVPRKLLLEFEVEVWRLVGGFGAWSVAWVPGWWLRCLVGPTVASVDALVPGRWLRCLVSG